MYHPYGYFDNDECTDEIRNMIDTGQFLNLKFCLLEEWCSVWNSISLSSHAKGDSFLYSTHSW